MRGTTREAQALSPSQPPEPTDIRCPAAKRGRGWFQTSLLAALGCLLGAQVLAAPVTVDHRLYRGTPDAPSAEHSPQLRAKRVRVPAPVIRLPPIRAEELEPLRRPSLPRQQPVGVGRPVPGPYAQDFDVALLPWSVQADGGLVAVFSVASPGAAGMRLQFRFGRFPRGAELRFYDPHNPGTSSDPLTRNALASRLSGDGSPYWSPVIAGDELAVEIYLPPGVAPGDLEFSTPRVSHLVTVARSGTAGEDPGGCSLDPACDYTGIPQAVVDSVALFQFSDPDGATFACSGTLLNDAGDTGARFYFLTANHCIASQEQAATMNFYWFYQRQACGADSPAAARSSLGGARLLATGTLPEAPELSLLELIEPPPAGVGLAGWTSATLPAGSAVTSIHHPGAGLKKISYGTAEGFASAAAEATSPVFIRTSWALGATEPGSSGAGLWADFGGALRLVGGLWGGNSSCAAPEGEDYFSRFDLAFPKLQPWLAPATATARVQLSGSVRWAGNPVCALVLANGQHQFSCDGGSYHLSVPRDAQGGVTIFGFADGFAPYSRRLTPSGDTLSWDLEMALATGSRPLGVIVDQVSRLETGTPATDSAIITGRIRDGEEPVCALVLANGQHMFSCQGTGAFELHVPLDDAGGITLFAFADGFAPYRTRF